TEGVGRHPSKTRLAVALMPASHERYKPNQYPYPNAKNPQGTEAATHDAADVAGEGHAAAIGVHRSLFHRGQVIVAKNPRDDSQGKGDKSRQTARHCNDSRNDAPDPQSKNQSAAVGRQIPAHAATFSFADIVLVVVVVIPAVVSVVLAATAAPLFLANV